MELLNPSHGSGGGSGGSAGYFSETLTYTNTTNGLIGPLSNVPLYADRANMFVVNGVPQDYITDFTIRQIIGGLNPGWYICISPTSTPVSGGSFFTGNNPATGIVGIMEYGDKVRVTYPIE